MGEIRHCKQPCAQPAHCNSKLGRLRLYLRMAYNYRAADLQQPTPDDVRAARLHLGQTQAAAAALVHRPDSSRWREWERDAPTGRIIDLAVWELYLVKSGLRVCT